VSESGGEVASRIRKVKQGINNIYFIDYQLNFIYLQIKIKNKKNTIFNEMMQKYSI
jgi:hypothetical protein